MQLSALTANDQIVVYRNGQPAAITLGDLANLFAMLAESSVIFTGDVKVMGKFGANNSAPQAPASVGALVPAGGVGAAAGGWDTGAHRDDGITALTNIRAALIACGLMAV